MYTDPGVLSMIIAAAVGAVIAVPAYFVIYRKKIMSWIYGKKKQKEERGADDKE